MSLPAIFFDRDNTLIINDSYLGDPAGVILADGAAAAVAKARELGYRVVTVSNQSGVARGFYAEADVVAVNAKLDELLRRADPAAVIDLHEYCPFHPKAKIERYRIDSDLRKPKPGMLLQAARKLDLDLARSWIIGDSPRDIEAGHAAGCRAILLQWPELPRSPAADMPSPASPDATVANLADAMLFIAAKKGRA